MERKEGAYVVRGEYTVKETLALYHGAIAAVAARLHANVFSAIQGVPVVALSYNPKVSGFMRWLGCPEYALGLNGLSAESIMEAVRRRLSDDEKNEEVRRRISEGRQEIGLYADMAMRLLSEGAGSAMQR
jgi:polysaccharide pyruvyl transferase WcaK-like protein